MKVFSALLIVLLAISVFFAVHYKRQSVAIQVLLDSAYAQKTTAEQKTADGYTRTKAAKMAMYSTFPIDTSDIVFIGNSITEGFPVTEYFQTMHVKNRGYAGNTSNDIRSYFMGIVNHHPKKIFLLMGINDIRFGIGEKEKMETKLIDNYSYILNAIHTASPNTIVYVETILPLHSDIDPNQTLAANNAVIEVNGSIKKLAQQFNYPVVDLYSGFAEHAYLPERYTTDGVHLNDKGYAQWYSLIKSYVN